MYNRKKRSDRLPESDRLLAEQFWIANMEVSPNAKDVIRLRRAQTPLLEHMIHKQYRTNEAIHLSFLQESGVLNMSRTIFDDCKHWFVKPGKVDTYLCKVCEDFRLAKKAATYNYELLLRPYASIRTVGKFMFASCLSLKLMRRKYGDHKEYMSDSTRRKTLSHLFCCIQRIDVNYRKPLCLHEQCSPGISVDDIWREYCATKRCQQGTIWANLHVIVSAVKRACVQHVWG